MNFDFDINSCNTVNQADFLSGEKKGCIAAPAVQPIGFLTASSPGVALMIVIFEMPFSICLSLGF